MDMKWFWRRVCSPDCSDTCHVYCPGCRALADEWREQGHQIPAGSTGAGGWQGFRHAVAFWSRSAPSWLAARLDPRRIGHRAPAPVVGCGCHPDQAGAGGTTGNVGDLPVVDVGIVPVPSYQAGDLDAVPADPSQASVGGGNPVVQARLRSGEVVLNLGSSGGMDALVAASQVGPDGHVFGLDMADERIASAGRTAAAAGVGNLAFLKGAPGAVPLPRESIDVIVGNCVINLVPDKARALREAYRVLRPHGRLSLSDIVTRRPVPDHLKGDLTACEPCLGGALSEDEFRAELAAAGFVDIEIERDREFTAVDADAAGLTPVLARAGLGGVIALGFANTSVRARRPAPAPVDAGAAAPAPVARVPGRSRRVRVGLATSTDTGISYE